MYQKWPNQIFPIVKFSFFPTVVILVGGGGAAPLVVSCSSWAAQYHSIEIAGLAQLCKIEKIGAPDGCNGFAIPLPPPPLLPNENGLGNATTCPPTQGPAR